MLNNNKGGQMFMIGIMVLIMSLLIFIATLPAVSNVMDDTRGCSNLNCAGYVDQDATGADCSSANQSYIADGNDNALSCTILDLVVPFIILGVIIALITLLMSGRLAQSPEPQYGGYPGQY